MSASRYQRKRFGVLYRQGWSDRRIADSLGVSRPTVQRWRARRGLPANLGVGGKDDDSLKLWRASLKRRLRADELRSCADYPHLRRRTEAVRRWSRALTPREADVLDVLERGPAAAAAVASALGLERPSWAGRLLRALDRRGLVRAGRRGKAVVYHLNTTRRG